MIDWKNHVKLKPEKLYGKPVLVNTRIPVDLILEKLAFGDTTEEVFEAFPRITRDDIAACLLFASKVVKTEVILPKAS